MTGTESADPSRVAPECEDPFALLLAVDEASPMISETLHVLADHLADPTHGALLLSPATIHIGRDGVAPQNDQEIVPSIQIHVVHASPRSTRP